MPTNPPLEIAFCADRNMLAAMHVAIRSVLESFKGVPQFLILSTDLEASDLSVLHNTLKETGKSYSLRFVRIDPTPFANFPRWGGSHANYFRFLIAELSDCDRCLYLDCDTSCYTDLGVLADFNLSGYPLALSVGAPISQCADKLIISLLGQNVIGLYYNAGVCLINCATWRNNNFKLACFNFILEHKPQFSDQSALNYCLQGRIAPLSGKFNFQTNVRANWPLLRKPNRGAGCLLHFVDYPKPWSAMGRWIHPFGQQWWGEYQKTAHFRENCYKPAPIRWDAKTWLGYRKALKDKLLFSLYERGMLLPKGVPA